MPAHQTCSSGGSCAAVTQRRGQALLVNRKWTGATYPTHIHPRMPPRGPNSTANVLSEGTICTMGLVDGQGGKETSPPPQSKHRINWPTTPRLNSAFFSTAPPPTSALDGGLGKPVGDIPGPSPGTWPPSPEAAPQQKTSAEQPWVVALFLKRKLSMAIIKLHTTIAQSKSQALVAKKQSKIIV